MNVDEKHMYADFLLGMKQRAKSELDSYNNRDDNSVARELYGDKYEVIRLDFKDRIIQDLNEGGVGRLRNR